MKRILGASILTSLLISPVVVLAQDVIPPGPQDIATILAIMNNIANWIFTIFLVVAVIFILLAAYQFVTSGGDPGKTTSARQSLLYAIVGIAVAFLARGLVTLVRVVLQVP